MEKFLSYLFRRGQRAMNQIRPVLGLLLVLLSPVLVSGADLDQVLQTGKLRHLGIIYANFVVPEKSGLDVELMQLFAAHLGVEYEFVETSWANVIADLTGKQVKPQGESVEILGEAPVRGDGVATGVTVLPWRKQIVDFSTPTFPTGVWLIAKADSVLQPIAPTGAIDRDIAAVKASLNGHSVLALANSCLAPELYGLAATGANVQLFPQDRNLDEMIPSVMAGLAETTLMDVPVALIALEKWSGEIKVIGPISPSQEMACAFPKDAAHLRRAFDEFFQQCKSDGTYERLVRKYYPSVFSYYGDFFAH